MYQPQVQTKTSAPLPAALPDKHRRTIQMNIRGKLRAALDLMVFGDIAAEGEEAGALQFNEAATKVGFSVQAMRKALERPHVRAYLKAQKEVFRASASAQNISVLVKLRNQAGNGMVQLGAIKELERIDDEVAASRATQRAGMVVVVVNTQPNQTETRVIEQALPLQGDADD